MKLTCKLFSSKEKFKNASLYGSLQLSYTPAMQNICYSWEILIETSTRYFIGSSIFCHIAIYMEIKGKKLGEERNMH